MGENGGVPSPRGREGKEGLQLSQGAAVGVGGGGGTGHTVAELVARRGRGGGCAMTNRRSRRDSGATSVGACVSEADRASRSEGGWGRCGPGERAGFRQVPIEDARVTVPEDTTGGPTHGGGSGAVEQTRGVACPGLMARALGRPRALASHLQPGDSIRDPGEEWGEAASRYFGIWTGSPWAFGWRPKKVTQPASFNTGLAFLHHFHPLSQLSGQTLQAGDQVALPSCHGAGLVSA